MNTQETSRIMPLVKQMPEEIPRDEAGTILSHARTELDVSRSQVSATPSMNRERLESFESTEIPLSESIWTSYVRAIQNRHDVSAAKASGLLNGLTREIMRHNDHKRP